MAVEVILPKVDMDMETGTISRWYAKDGDHVTKGQLLFEIETDKAAMEVDAPASGILSGTIAAEGAVVPVGQPVAWIYAEGEALSESQGESTASTVEKASVELVSQETKTGYAIADVSNAREGAMRATPLARRMATHAGLSLASIQGSGPNGRIQRKDVESQLGQPAASVQETGGEECLNAIWLREGDRGLLPIVLLHGFASDLNSWRAVLQVGAIRNPVLGIDLPSHGKSPQRAVRQISDLVLPVEEVLAAKGIKRCLLVGHSLGGAVATHIAHRPVVAVEALLLLSSGGLGPEVNGDFIRGLSRATNEKSITPWLKQLFGDQKHLSAAFIQATVSQARDIGKRTALQAVAASLFADDTQCFDIRNLLPSLNMPLRLIFGTADRVIPSKQALGLPGAVALHLFTGCGHMPQIEEKEAVFKILCEMATSANQRD